ncbi:MAG: ATP synthase subunit a [Herpetosiphonaceae bacterium]|nr:MAG: ATP synthase subunit a [Herpetosiphonaceae bacterium]
MSNTLKKVLIVLGVVGLMVGSRFIAGMDEIPPISIAPEVVFRVAGYPVTNSLLLTLLADVLLVGLAFVATRKLRNGEGLVPRGLQNFAEMSVEGIYNLCRSVDRRNVDRFFAIAATIFFFVLFSNWLALLPGMGSIGVCRTHEQALVNPVHLEEQPVESPLEGAAPGEHTAEEHAAGPCGVDDEGHELVLVPLFRSPSADLNMTLALALISFFVTEYFGFKAFGLGYLGKFFNFKEGPIMAGVGILELISEFVRIIAFTFRLFGNIFAGEVVLLVMAFLLPWLLPLPFYGFEVFVGFIQAFIFMILTVAFIAMALTPHHPHGEVHEHPTPS